jgi:hypothetical protein
MTTDRIAQIKADAEDHRRYNPDDVPFLLAEVERLTAELDRLHSWDGLMELMDEHWPADIFPTRPDDPNRDPGPRIVSLLRWVAGLASERDAATERESARWVEALTSDEAVQAACDEAGWDWDADGLAAPHPHDAMRPILQAAADTIRGQA